MFIFVGVIVAAFLVFATMVVILPALAILFALVASAKEFFKTP